jgi:hypothetical protein
MNVLRCLPVPAWLVLCLPCALAADLAKIDRTILKEPVYKSTPRYCLAVFGPEATTRVWLVVDGDVLYADTNGNGDLTEANERFAANELYPEKATRQSFKGASFSAITIAAADGKTKYFLHVYAGSEESGKWEMSASVVLPNKLRQSDFVELSGSAKGALVSHFDGPLAMVVPQPKKQTWPVRSKERYVAALIGTSYVVNGEVQNAPLIEHSVKGHPFPADLHPRAEIVFRHKDPRHAPIVLHAVLNKRC